MNYEVASNNEVTITSEAGTKLVQPTWPDGTPWASKTQATNWAKAYIAFATGESELAPGDNPSNPTKEVVEVTPLTPEELRAKHIAEGGTPEPEVVEETPAE